MKEGENYSSINSDFAALVFSDHNYCVRACEYSIGNKLAEIGLLLAMAELHNLFM